MRKRLALLMLLAATVAHAAPKETDVLKTLLDEFLAGASIGSVEIHERFWADELVYTSSSGTRTDKASIIGGMRASEAERPEAPAVVYTAEDVDIRVYGDTAVVAFRLIGTEQASGDRMEYFNTGTFLRRDGEWRAVAWQATKIPPPE